MSTSIIFYIILVFWVFILQNRVKDLEKLVNNMRHKVPSDTIEENESHYVIEEESLVNTDTEDDLKKPYESAISAIIEKQETVYHVEDQIEEYTPKLVQEQEPKESFLVSLVKNYFTGGNLLVRVGGVILFFGLAFLVKYAAEHSTISMEMRLISLSIIAVGLVATGWKLREREGAYGQILQGLGIAILYLVIYAASKFYELLSLDIAFGLMLLVVVLGSILAVVEDALPLSLFATVGGFLVPILTSSGEGSHVVLFSYYLFLNLGLFLVAWHRTWRILNIVGFIFTFVISGYWGVLRYDVEIFATTEPFLILYFLMYLGISILFTMKHPFKPKNLVDGTLVFGLPVVAFPLQLSLVEHIDYGAAYSAVVLGILYIVLSKLLAKRERTELLSQSFLALGVVFLTIAVPYIFDADMSAVLWSLESSAIIWLSLKQSYKYRRYFGEILLLISIFVYPDSISLDGISVVEYIGYIIIIIASLLASYLLNTHQKQLSKLDRYMPNILLFLSIVLWFDSAIWVIDKFDISYSNAMILYLSLGAILCFIANRFIQWKLLVSTLQGYIILGILIFFMGNTDTLHPFGGIGYLSLATLTVVNYYFLYSFDKDWRYTKVIHIISLWFIAIVLVLELRYHADLLQLGESFIQLATAIVPVLLSIFVLMYNRYRGWLEPHRHSYQYIGVGGLITSLILWEIQAFKIAPDFTLFSYIPLLNPLDIIQIVGLGVVFYWVLQNKQNIIERVKISLYSLLAFISTILISVIFARAVHMFRDIDYMIASMWQSIYFQAGLSILWSSVAIILMLLSKRYISRPLWLSGFGLLVIVVLKLFFVELSSSGTIERIISFIVVGSLLLLIGYFVPLPPNDEKEEIKEDENE